MNKAREMTRREFLKVSGLMTSSAAIGLMPFLSGCGFPAAPEIDQDAFLVDGDHLIVRMDKTSLLSRVGDSAAVSMEEDDIHLIIVRIGEERYVVALNECPHREKRLGYDPGSEIFLCVTGKSEFKLDGSYLKGPVEAPLRIYKSTQEGKTLLIDLKTDKMSER
ncbi:MAG TPA: Rieske 2Fe-2S domain-containing protein [Dehalococcoidia bacterium]|nr:Rieske 2Fe-2S domain-containing protein [Dehalococcoidia bacterium]